MVNPSDVVKSLRRKKFSVGLGDDPDFEVRRLRFDVPLLDAILGGGMAFGRLGLIVGGFGAGKTFLCQMAIRSAQRERFTTAFIDVEGAFDPKWFEKTGIDLSQLIVAQAPVAEDALEMLLALCEEGVELIVLDSIGALLPKQEEEADMGQSFIGLQARVLNHGLRKLVKLNRRSVVLMTNQLRSSMNRFQAYSLPGGIGQQFFASYILRIERGPRMIEDKKLVGFYMKVRTEKNKLATPFQDCAVPFVFGEGFMDSISGVVQLALDYGIVGRSGIWVKYGGQTYMGRKNLISFLQSDEEAFTELRKLVDVRVVEGPANEEV